MFSRGSKESKDKFEPENSASSTVANYLYNCSTRGATGAATSHGGAQPVMDGGARGWARAE